MSLKNKLQAQAQKTLPTSHKTVTPTEVISELDKITHAIRSDLTEIQEIQEFVLQKRIRYAELRESIVTKLIYIRDNKKTLLSGSSFESYLENSIGITKGYFYEQVQAYELCQQYDRLDLFSTVDYKILVMIAREKDKNRQKLLINRATTLKRDSFKEKVSLDDNFNFSLETKRLSNTEVVLKFPSNIPISKQEDVIQYFLQRFNTSKK